MSHLSPRPLIVTQCGQHPHNEPLILINLFAPSQTGSGSQIMLEQNCGVHVIAAATDMQKYAATRILMDIIVAKR